LPLSPVFAAPTGFLNDLRNYQAQAILILFTLLTKKIFQNSQLALRQLLSIFTHRFTVENRWTQNRHVLYIILE